MASIFIDFMAEYSAGKTAPFWVIADGVVDESWV
jgi:hypothetical protein